MANTVTTDEPYRDRPISPLDSALIFHVFPTFGVGGVQVRMTEVINHLGDAFRHTILALDGNYACKDRLSAEVPVTFLPPHTEQRGLIRDLGGIRATLHRLRPDLLLTYNWGAIEWAFANTVSPISRHIHLESGFGLEEADHQFLRRMLFRRIALARSWRVVVPSETLVRIATQDWKLPSEKVTLIPNGVDWTRFDASPDPADRLEFSQSPDTVVIGAVGPLRPEKNLAFLLDAFAALTTRFDLRLVIIGKGSEEPALRQRAQALGISDKVTFTGHLESVERELALLDVFALTSRTEQMPNSVLQAMAAAKIVVAVDVGDVKLMLSPDNRTFVTPKGDIEAFVTTLEQVLGDAEIRARIGARNRTHVQEHYPQERMVEAYRKLFAASINETSPSGPGRVSAGRQAKGTFTVNDG